MVSLPRGEAELDLNDVPQGFNDLDWLDSVF